MVKGCYGAQIIHAPLLTIAADHVAIEARTPLRIDGELYFVGKGENVSIDTKVDRRGFVLPGLCYTQMTMDNRFLLIDFDGVVVDSLHIGWEINHSFRPEMTKEQYLSLFEGNIYEKFDEIDKGSNEDREEDQKFFELYAERILDEPPIKDIVEVFAKLNEDHTLIVISSSINAPIERYLEEHNIRHAFDAVMGADVHKSKREKMRMVFEKYGTSAKNCVFITDTLGDMREAHAMGVGSIAVSWGFHPHETLEKGVPFRIIDRADELPDTIEDYFKEME